MRLANLDTVLEAAGREGQSPLREREIPLDQIVGSTGESKKADFDPGFLPVSSRSRDRWTALYREMVEGGEVPPIDVYEVEGRYYVADGHHRVSVARALDRPMIRARITQVRTRAPLPAEVDPSALLRAAEYRQFLERTGLDRVRPEARLECSRLGRYAEIEAHILGHAYFLGLERGQPVAIEEAAASWYDQVYLPVVELIRTHHAQEALLGWTETDLYVEITRRWLALSEAGEESGPRQALDRVAADYRPRGLARWRKRRRLRLD